VGDGTLRTASPQRTGSPQTPPTLHHYLIGVRFAVGWCYWELGGGWNGYGEGSPLTEVDVDGLMCPVRQNLQNKKTTRRKYKREKNYRKKFFKAHPKVKGNVIVHHAVEQQVLKRYPGLFTKKEIHSIKNLRGIPKQLNSGLHLSEIRKSWNGFYKNNPNPTKNQVLQHAQTIDKNFGHLFDPPT